MSDPEVLHSADTVRPAGTHPRGTIRVQPRYTMECETCGWRSYPYLEEDAAIGEWREHVREHRAALIDGRDDA